MQTAIVILTPIPESLSFTEIFDFAPQNSGGPTCVAYMDPYQKMSLGLIVPMLFLVELALTMALHWLLARLCPGSPQSRSTVGRLMPAKFNVDPYM